MKKEWTGERLETNIHSQVTTEHLHRYALAMEFAEGKTVLDIACGDGYGSSLLAQRAKFVTGVDIDNAVIDAARKKYKEGNVFFQQGSVEKITLEDNSVNLVVSFETLEHTANHDAMLSEIKRVLMNNGLMILSTPDKKWYTDESSYKNPFHEKELYADELETLLKNHFRHVTILHQKHFSGSIMLSKGLNSDGHFYGGSFQSISKQTEMQAPYLVAFACDDTPLEIAPSFFEGVDVVNSALQQQEQQIKNTVTYKVGDLILSPAKWFKKIFKSS